VSKAIMTYM